MGENKEKCLLYELININHLQHYESSNIKQIWTATETLTKITPKDTKLKLASSNLLEFNINIPYN